METNNIIVVWNESTRCAIHNNRADAKATIVNLLESSVTLNDIRVFESCSEREIKIDWKY